MKNLDEKALSIFTDGSSYSNPRKGGFGARFIWYDENLNEQIFDYQPIGSYEGATSQQMELKACVEALTVVNGDKIPFKVTKESDLEEKTPFTAMRFSKIVIYTDSMYIIDNKDNAKFSWSKNKWRTKDGKPVLNAQLWKDLVAILKKIRKRVEFSWEKGHKSSVHNKAVDKLAKMSAKKIYKQKLSHVRVRRKKSDKIVEIGSVKMNSQRMIIRIITDEYLRIQKCYKYKYEVMSKKSPYYMNVDLIYSEIMLSAGHIYDVSVNNNPKNPQILECNKEIT